MSVSPRDGAATIFTTVASAVCCAPEPPRSAKFNSRRDNPVPDVLAIKPLISQVFSNIIENAIKYSDKDTTVEIKGRYNPEDDAAIVSIRSHGVPLSAEDAERVFDRGYRTRGAADAYPAGTGFGLYIARKIVEIHEGLIRVVVVGPRVTSFEVLLYPRKLQGKAHEWPKRRSS